MNFGLVLQLLLKFVLMNQPTCVLDILWFWVRGVSLLVRASIYRRTVRDAFLGAETWQAMVVLLNLILDTVV